jgi:hypothetical protein
MMIRNRVIDIRWVTAADVAPHPRNWRRHPDRQHAMLQSLLERIGVAGAVIAYHSARNHGALTLIDGHERMSFDVPFPALILDVTDDEADMLLATYDPIGDMVDYDHQTLEQLLADIGQLDAALAPVLDAVAGMHGVFPDAPTLPPITDIAPLVDQRNIERSPLIYRSIHVHFPSAEAVEAFAQLLHCTITPKTTYIWYPAAPTFRTAYLRASDLSMDHADDDSSAASDH